jgi:hypothetical protein
MIEIFPERMLDSSIHTSILVGLLWLWGATEAFGWVFAGFVVPGYLAAIGSVAPLTAAAIVVEAVLTYGIAWALIAGAAEVGLWGRAFGRERFLAFVLVSVPVRLLVEGVAAPGLEALIAPLLGLHPAPSGRFFGLGVVLVPLLANSFWKTGLLRGVIQVGACTLATAAVLHGVLRPLTNFHFGAFEFLFEDLAQDFLAVPKVYIVLLVTVFVAARNKLDFGWDFGGILVPALLAMLVFHPFKLVTTLGEVVVLVWAFQAVRKIPWVRGLNIDGPRMLVFVYSLGYGLKWAFALVATEFDLPMRVSDLYGFGYLLTALIAVRCVKAGGIAKIVVPLGFTTAQGLALGLLVSVGLTFLLPPASPSQLEPSEPGARGDAELEVLLAYANVRGPLDTTRQGAAGLALGRALAALAAEPARPQLEWLQRQAAPLRAAGIEAEIVSGLDDRPCLSARVPRSGLSSPPASPSLLWCGGDGPLLYVPRPGSDPESLIAAAWLARRALVAGVIVEAVDTGLTLDPAPYGASRRDRAAWERTRRLVGDRPVAIVRSAAGAGGVEPVGPPAVGPIRTHLGPLASTTLLFGEASDALGPLWEDLRASDAVLQVGHAQLDAALEQDRALAPVSPLPAARFAGEGRPARRVVEAGIVLGIALRGAREPGPPRALVRYLCERFGVSLRLEDGPGDVWLLAGGPGAPAGWGTWRLDPLGRPLVVTAPRAAAEAGTGELAFDLARRGGAAIAWSSDAGGRLGEVEPASPLDDRMALPQLLLREALAPRAGELPRLLEVRRQQTPNRPGPSVTLSSAREAAASTAGRLPSAFVEALGPWPEPVFADDGEESASLRAFGGFAPRYLEKLSPGAASAIWFSPRILDELPGSPARAARAEGYAELGLRLEEVAPSILLAGVVDRERPQPPLASALALRAHAETGSRAALQEALATPGEQVRALAVGPRIVLVAEGERVVCSVVAGTRAEDAFPWSGCWSRR